MKNWEMSLSIFEWTFGQRAGTDKIEKLKSSALRFSGQNALESGFKRCGVLATSEAVSHRISRMSLFAARGQFRIILRRMLPDQLAVDPRRAMSGAATWSDLVGSLRPGDGFFVPVRCTSAGFGTDVGDDVDDSVLSECCVCSVGDGVGVGAELGVQVLV